MLASQESQTPSTNLPEQPSPRWGIDSSLLDITLKLTVDERLRRLQDWMRSAEELKRAGKSELSR